MNNLNLQIQQKTYETSKHSESMNIPGCSEDDDYTHRVQEALATEYWLFWLSSPKITISFSPTSGLIINHMDSGVYGRDHTVKQTNREGLFPPEGGYLQTTETRILMFLRSMLKLSLQDWDHCTTQAEKNTSKGVGKSIKWNNAVLQCC